MNLLDRVKTIQKDMNGIVDYLAKKHIIFYDFTRCNDTNLILLVMLWRLSEDHDTRFSIFCKTNFPHITLPPPVVIPTNSIKNKKEVGIVYTIPTSKVRKVTLT